MTYNVQIGSGGYLGWKVLERTAERQRAVFEQDMQIRNSRDYFSENITNVSGAEELVSDYKLLNVALRAFGLDADIGNRAFIKKVLESDPSDSKSIVNKLSDKRYLSLNKAFGFGSSNSSPPASMDVSGILDMYVSRSFEKNIGERYEEIELALNAQRELPSIASNSSSANAKWYQIIASKPLRKIFEGAFGLDSSFGQIPVDRQLAELQKRFERLTGTTDIAELSKPESLSKLLKNYLLRSQLSESTTSSPYSIALTILRGS